MKIFREISLQYVWLKNLRENILQFDIVIKYWFHEIFEEN